MDKKDIFLTKVDSMRFNKHTLVKYITCINECYLVEDLNDRKREYIYYSELYPIDWSPQNFRGNFKFDEKLQAIAEELIK
jgi:hypothetical protein